MRETWSSYCGKGGRSKFTSTKNHSADGKNLNTLVASSMEKCLKLKKESKANAKDDSNLDAELENINFENIETSADPDS